MPLSAASRVVVFLINLSRVAANDTNQSSRKDSASRDLGREKRMGDF